MKILLLSIGFVLTSCFALPKNRTVYELNNGIRQVELEVKYSSPCENGAEMYWLVPVKGSKMHGRLRIVDTLGRYHHGDKITVTLP